MEIVVSTNSGGEEFLLQELGELGYRGEILKPTKVKVEASPKDVVRLNLMLRQAHRVYVLLWRGEVEGLEDVERAAQEVSLSPYFKEGFTYGVRGKRYGEHPFTSVDVGRAVGTGLWKSLEREGLRPRVNLRGPDVEVHAELSGRELMILLNTSGESLHKRYERPFQHHAPLKASIAATLLYASSFKEKGKLLDPMVGGGTIPIEAWMLYTNRYPGLYRKEYAFLRLEPFAPYYEEVLEEIKALVREEEPFLWGMDLLRKNVLGARENLKALGVKALLMPGDVCRVRMKAGVVATNPPYGLRIASKRYIEKVYRCFAKNVEAEEVVALTAEGQLMARALEGEGYRIELYKRFLYGSLETRLIRATAGGR